MDGRWGVEKETREKCLLGFRSMQLWNFKFYLKFNFKRSRLQEVSVCYDCQGEHFLTNSEDQSSKGYESFNTDETKGWRLNNGVSLWKSPGGWFGEGVAGQCKPSVLANWASAQIRQWPSQRLGNRGTISLDEHFEGMAPQALEKDIPGL